MSEELSALIDNELDELQRARLLKELRGDESLAGLWSRYHVIGLAMRREAIVPDDGLAESVSARLRQEAAPRGRAAGLRPVPRLAVAASVAGVLLLGGVVMTLYQGIGGGDAAPAAAARVAEFDGATRWEGADPSVEDELNAMLVEHSEFTSASGMNGLTAYTKFVAYDSP